MQTLFSKGFWKMVSGFVVIILVAISIMLGVGLYGQKLNAISLDLDQVSGV
ncbi:MAG: hypothetical protein QG609_448 [Patescibacteria group bacterium]|nr:hypothetical protein [Patescibacteria group bacterium]